MAAADGCDMSTSHVGVVTPSEARHPQQDPDGGLCSAKRTARDANPDEAAQREDEAGGKSSRRSRAGREVTLSSYIPRQRATADGKRCAVLSAACHMS